MANKYENDPYDTLGVLPGEDYVGDWLCYFPAVHNQDTPLRLCEVIWIEGDVYTVLSIKDGVMRFKNGKLVSGGSV